MPTNTPSSNDPLARQRERMNFDDALNDFVTAVLTFYDHEILRVNQELREAGIESPLGSAGVSDLHSQRETERDRLIDLMEAEVSDERLHPGRHGSGSYINGMQYMIEFLKNLEVK